MKSAQDLVNAAKSRIREIDHEELLRLQAQGVPIVDVREPEEFQAGDIPGSVNIPRGVLEFQVDGHPAVSCAMPPCFGAAGRPSC